MKTFLKLDRADDEMPVITEVHAETLQNALKNALEECMRDDRLDPCSQHGSRSECLRTDDDSVQWSPGDGCDYTIIVIAEATPEGMAKLESYLVED